MTRISTFLHYIARHFWLLSFISFLQAGFRYFPPDCHFMIFCSQRYFFRVEPFRDFYFLIAAIEFHAFHWYFLDSFHYGRCHYQILFFNYDIFRSRFDFFSFSSFSSHYWWYGDTITSSFHSFRSPFLLASFLSLRRMAFINSAFAIGFLRFSSPFLLIFYYRYFWWYFHDIGTSL